MMENSIGVLMLDTTFHRPVGDIGNPGTFSFPLQYKVVKQATVSQVVNTNMTSSTLELFIQAAKELERRDVKAIATSCGFLAVFQKKIQSVLNIPFYSSSLLQIPLIHMTAGGPIGILTASKDSLTEKHLKGVDAYNYPLVVKGMDNMPAFTDAIIKETAPLDQATVITEIKQAIFTMMLANPNLQAIVLECTNMPPYRDAIREVTNIPVFDMNTLINYMYSSLK